jgi:hypothetical protein
MEIPFQIQVARTIARKVLKNPKKFGIPQSEVDRIKTFLGETWEQSWGKTDFKDWESSFYWAPIRDRLPAISEKLK